MSYQTNSPNVHSIVDVLSELEKSIAFFLQNPQATEGLDPGEHVPPIEAPVDSQTDIKFFMGEIEKYSHITRPFIVWTLGDTRQEGSQARGSRSLNPVSPRPFKKSLDLITCSLAGAVLEGAAPGLDGDADPASQADRWKRGTVRGCEILRWAFWWATRERWAGNVRFEREGWIEVSGNNQVGYAWASSFRVPMSQMRPNNLTLPRQPLDIDIQSR